MGLALAANPKLLQMNQRRQRRPARQISRNRQLDKIRTIEHRIHITDRQAISSEEPIEKRFIPGSSRAVRIRLAIGRVRALFIANIVIAAIGQGARRRGAETRMQGARTHSITSHVLRTEIERAAAKDGDESDDGDNTDNGKHWKRGVKLHCGADLGVGVYKISCQSPFAI